MSFARPFSEARDIQGNLQHHKTDGNDDGASSPVKTPGGSTPIIGGPSAPVGEMNASRTKLKPGTSGMRRSWY